MKIGFIIGVLVGGLVVAAVMLGRRAPEVVTIPPPSPAPIQQASGPTSVQLTADEQTQIGIQTTEVRRQTIQREITAPGKVVENETGLGVISARIGGRIETLLVNVTGETVNRGQAVAQIYSPEIFAMAEEYRLSLENRQRLNESREPQAIADADALVQASRRRLELRGLTTQQIEENSLLITIYSPLAGVVTKRNVTEGQYIAEGDALYTVSDLSTVWIQADIFDSDIAALRAGQAARITAPTMPGTLRGTIGFLQPSVDPQTRTMVARIQVSNPQMRLRPGMFVQVAVDAPLGGNILAVPRSAVLETGEQKVVYVAHPDGVFEKRPIEATAAGDEYYAVSGGLEAGERIVTHGNFLLDSQTRLSGNITGMFGGSKSLETTAAPGGYNVTFRTEPSPPRGAADGEFHVSVTDPAGNPAPDAQVQVQLLMPAMPSMGMAEMRSAFNLAWNGSEYVGSGTIPMAGPWNVTVEARRGGQLLGSARTRFDAR